MKNTLRCENCCKNYSKRRFREHKCSTQPKKHCKYCQKNFLYSQNARRHEQSYCRKRPVQFMLKADVVRVSPLIIRDIQSSQNQINICEEKSFALPTIAPLKGVSAQLKRKLIVDEVKTISDDKMESQIANTSDTITTLDLAPPTKRLMYWKDTGRVEKLFTLSTTDIKATVLVKVTVNSV